MLRTSCRGCIRRDDGSKASGLFGSSRVLDRDRNGKCRGGHDDRLEERGEDLDWVAVVRLVKRGETSQ